MMLQLTHLGISVGTSCKRSDDGLFVFQSDKLQIINTVLNHSLFQPEAVQTLYMRVLHRLYQFRPECHSMVSTVFDRQHPGTLMSCIPFYLAL